MSEAILGLEFGKPQAPPSTNGGAQSVNEGENRAEEEDGPPPSKRIRCRKTVGFDSVTVYYFQRTQGFTCVPSQGGSTLGMSPMHVEKRTFSLRQHANERRRLQFGDVDCSNTSSSSSSLSPDDTAGSSSSAGDIGDAYQGAAATLEEDTAEEDDEEADEEGEAFSYLQPVPTRQRRALLRASGVRKIDALEKEECRDIRASREFCGCACKGRCLPESCSCSIAGISCQAISFSHLNLKALNHKLLMLVSPLSVTKGLVDRLSFPCGCTQEGCGNTSGRTEFNPVRVRSHFLHTLMRLEFEKQQASGNLGAFPCVDPRRLIYYNASGAAAAAGMTLPACHYSSEEDEEDEEDSSYSENSDYATEEEEGDGTELADGRPGSPHPDYTDLSCAVARGGESTSLASRGLVPVDPVFVGCGDCATDGLLSSAAEGAEAGTSSTTEDGSSSTATTDSAFGEIIKASLGEVSTL